MEKSIIGFIVDWDDINSPLNTFFFYKDKIIDDVIFYSEKYTEETGGVCKAKLLDTL